MLYSGNRHNKTAHKLQQKHFNKMIQCGSPQSELDVKEKLVKETYE